VFTEIGGRDADSGGAAYDRAGRGLDGVARRLRRHLQGLRRANRRRLRDRRASGPAEDPHPAAHDEGEDELSFIVEGEFGFKVGDRVFTAGPGSYVFKPPRIPHTWWNGGDQPARLIEIIWPAGFEHFFEELGAAFEVAGGGPPDPERVKELSKRYRTPYLMEWVPELERTYRVSVLHSGGRSGTP
jgi:mannose-6-phosphate isomerase-like protein (cupin superfamily)